MTTFRPDTHSIPLSKEMQHFLNQNTLCGAGMSFEQIQTADDAQLAGTHSGGLYVLQGEITEGTSAVQWYVKMHDSWGPEYEVIVHSFHPDNDFDTEGNSLDHVDTYADPREAAEAFLTILGIR